MILRAVIDRYGEVHDIEVLRSQPFGLEEAAVKAVETWKFEPASLDGRPVAVVYHLTIRFALQ